MNMKMWERFREAMGELRSAMGPEASAESDEDSQAVMNELKLEEGFDMYITRVVPVLAALDIPLPLLLKLCFGSGMLWVHMQLRETQVPDVFKESDEKDTDGRTDADDRKR